MKFLYPALFLSCLFSVTMLSAQIPTTQDCLGAIPVCQQVYTEAQVPNSNGNYPNEINPNISCTAGEINAIWYTFTANETGDFGFLITPNDLNDDYDWALFDITTATCADILTNPNLVVSCNAAGGFACHGSTGANGGSNFNNQGGGCSTFPPLENAGFSPFNALVPVVQGNTYVLMVSNWSMSPNGYSIDFGLSDVGIIDNILPDVQNISTPTECNQNAIVVDFSEFLQCNTVNDFNFELIGPGGPYDVSVSGSACDVGGAFEKTYTLLIDPPIASRGTFTLQINGSNPTQLLDLCDNPTPSTQFTFDVDDPIPVDIELGQDTTLVCVGETYTLDATIPGGLSYMWEDGSTDPTFTVDQPGIYAVTVENACGFGEDEIEVIYQMEPPQIELGDEQTPCEGDAIVLDAFSDLATYEWSDGSMNPTLGVTTSGTYSVSVTNACGTTIDEVGVDFIQPIVLDLGEDQLLCAGATVVLDASQVQDYSAYLWQDGSTDPTFTVTESGVYTVLVDNGCESQADEVEITFVPGLPTVELGPDISLCPGETLTLDVTNDLATYLWQDGSTGATFTVTEPGTYTVEVENVCGVVADEIVVEYYAAINVDLGPDQLRCAGEIVALDADQSQDVATYLWQDGSTNPTFTVTESGIYTVVVDNGCESQSDEVEITFVPDLPQVDLGPDIILCEGETLMLDVTNDLATYFWQDGSTGATFTVTGPGTYTVEVENACGTVTDEIVVEYINAIDLDLGPDQVRCEGEVVTLDAGQDQDFATYIWQDGSTDPTYELDKEGMYSVTVTTDCEEVIDDIEVLYISLTDPVNLGPDTLLCPEDTLVLDVSIPQGAYQWQDGSTDSVFVVRETGTYAVTVSSACDTTFDEVIVQYIAPILTELGRDTFFCPGEPIVLDASSQTESTYVWQDGTTSPVYRVQEPGVYSVTVSNNCQVVVDEVEVFECEICDVYVPNAFSPNDDGFNDEFGPLSDCVLLNYNFKIFDRWGALLYESENPDETWDGENGGDPQATGVYVWVLEYTVIENNRPRAARIVGDISLLR